MSSRETAGEAAGSAVAEARIQIGLAWPIALAQFGMVALGLVDTAFVGRVSRVELASVALGRSLSFALSSIGFGVASANDPLVAQALGAGQPGRAWSALTRTVRVVVFLSGPAVAVTVGVTWLLPWAGVSSEVVLRTRAFLVAQIPNQIALSVFFAAKSFLQAHGVTRPALVGSLVANAVNVVVCASIVRGDDSLRALGLPGVGLPRLGAVGAAVASDVAAILLMGIVLVAARRFRVPVTSDPVSTTAVLRLGIPIGLQFAAEIGVFSLAALLAGRLGDVALSGHQIALGLASFTFMGALGVSGATAVRVGHAVGAGKSPRRTGLVGMALGSGAMIVGAVAFAAIPGTLVRIFTDDGTIVEVAVPLLRVAAAFQLFDGLQVVAAGALRGAGDVRLPFVANVISHWCIGLPVAVVLAFVCHMGALGLWLGLTVGLVTAATALATRFAVLSRGAIRALP
jgi:multidrug resistance protein, MATE family